MNKNCLLCLFGFLSFSAVAQIGSEHSFEFLNIPANARLAALGGVNVSLADRDVNFFTSNPALVSDTLSGWGSAAYQFYIADIGQAGFSYAHPFDKAGVFVFGIQHIGYGTIDGYDASGMEIGEFKSGETVIVMGKSHQINHFRLGVNLKAVFSSIAGFRSNALMIDLGGVFRHPGQQFTAGIAIKNVGVVLSEYSNTSSTSLPFDVQVGATFKPEHMPLRFSITAYNLARSQIIFSDVSGDDEPGALDKVLRRFNFGAEILLHRNFNILFGYNYLIHQELKLEEGGGGAGVSVGLSCRVKSFEFSFARNGYVAGVGAYTFTLASNIKNMLTRRQL